MSKAKTKRTTDFVIDQSTRKDALRVLGVVIRSTHADYQKLRTRRGPKAKALANHVFVAAAAAYTGLGLAKTTK